jgi:chemotaxis protein methyltransferase CheR
MHEADGRTTSPPRAERLLGFTASGGDPMTDQDYDFIRRLLQERSAIALDDTKQYLVESRLLPLARKLGLSSISELVSRLRSRSIDGAHDQVVEAMVTTETSFFRDLHPFEALKKSILPDLVQKRRGERRLDIWCAACASGQEPYSVAILLRESFPELAGWSINLLATDLSKDMLARAQAGKFSQIEVNRGLPVSLLVKYFQQHGTTWELSAGIRAMVQFRWLNLSQAWPTMPRMDLVVMRNVMIYFEVPTKKEILSRVSRVLRKDGYLLLGGAETTLNLDDSFRRVEHHKTGFYQLTD